MRMIILLILSLIGGVVSKPSALHQDHEANMKFFHKQMHEECKVAEVNEATMKLLDAEIETTFKLKEPPNFEEFHKLSHEEMKKKMKERGENDLKLWGEMKEKLYPKISDAEQVKRLKVCLIAHEKTYDLIMSKGDATGYYMAFHRSASEVGLAKKTMEHIHTMMDKQNFGHFSIVKDPCDLTDADKKKISEELDTQLKKLKDDATASQKDAHLPAFFDKAAAVIQVHQALMTNLKCKDGKMLLGDL